MYIQKHIFILLSFIICLFSFSQGQNSDCDDLLVLKDTIYHSYKIKGYGEKKEFDGNTLEDKETFEKEENSIWYFITAQESGVFTFDIITKDNNDDWDFLLYRNKPKFCKRIANKVIKPIRSNLSRSPITGLSMDAEDVFVSAGINNNYSKYVKVKKGDEFILVVNNPKRSGGRHTLILHLPQPKKEIIVVKKPSTATNFKLIIKDAKTKKPLAGYANILGLQDTNIQLEAVDNYALTVSKKNRNITIETYAKGYMLKSDKFRISKNKTKFLATILLEKIGVGKRVSLEKIQFYGNRFDLVPEAETSLKTLLFFMERNPTVKIEIEGHVNGPNQRNSKSYKELSYNRAYTVKRYLTKKGIAKERIDFKGYGNAKMLFPKPKGPYQEAANRRVEIKITSK